MGKLQNHKMKGNINNLTSIVVALLSIILLFTTSTPYYANSAQTQWSGVDATGTMVTDENSPIVVEKEVLTFDITEFPANYYRDMAEYLAYSGKVTAEYTFYNPSDYTVTATLLFPYGKVPDYGERYNYNAEEYVYNADADKYTITIDGQEVQTTIRHTLSYYYSQFSLTEDLPKVVDGYMTDSFYSPDLPVYCVTYNVTDIEQKTATVALKWSGDESKTKLIVEGASGGQLNSNNVELSCWAGNNSQVRVWIFGEYEHLPQWTVYKNGACDEVVAGKVELATKEPVKQMSLKEYVLQDYNAESGILENDWYNAKVQELKGGEWKYGVIRNDRGVGTFDKNLLRWYEYEITLEPGQRIVNTVTAPMYPSINLKYDPDIYSYTYLLSPATTWKAFGNLDIILNTPYYITVSSIEGYEKTENGYQWKLSGLPEGELEFTLCTDPNPKAPVTTYNIFTAIMNFLFSGAIFVIGFVAIVVILIGTGVIIYKAKKRKVTRDDN